MKKFLQYLASFSGLILLFASLSNFYLAYRASSVVSSTVVTNYVEIASAPSSSAFPSPSSPSNVLDQVKTLFVPTSSPSSSAPPPPPPPKQSAEYPYQYFLVGRRIGAHMFGRYYYEGSPCSLGRIKAIYPDRIILDSGDWIQNRLERSERMAHNDR